jgi:hypothetical protein
MRIATLSLLTILCLALSAPAFADLYNNGATLGNTNGWFIDVFQVSDSFTVSANASMTDFTFAEWVTTGSTPLTVDWAVGTTSFGSDVGSGTGAAITSSLVCTNGSPFNGGLCAGGFGYDIYNSTVTTNDLPLTAGTTYWLSLTNATDSFGGRDAWDINSGASLAYHNTLGQVPSESFTISGGTTTSTSTTTTGTTPEPSSIMLFGSGILGLAGVLRRKLSL